MKCPSCHTDNPLDAKFCKECATPLPSAEPGPPLQPGPPSFTKTLESAREELTTGSLFAHRYQIVEELGHGGMGRVYRAVDKKLNEEIALKLIRPEIAADRSTLERFHNELKLARRISHPHVGRMYELMEDAGTHFITMEYVPGQDLRGLIRQTGQLTVGKAVAIGKEICEGLAEAHKQGIVHRDLKPSNIIIDRAGDARIMDFGIARSLAVKSRTGVGVMIGTPEYMSPEQVEGREVGARSDIYSLGIILYEMLTGRVPFEGDTPFTVGVKHKSETPKNPKVLNPNIPDDLSGIILRCLEKEPSKRYPSAADVRAELERVEQGLPTAERVSTQRRPFTSREITVKFQPKKLIVPALAVFALAAVVMVILKVMPAKKTAPRAPGKPTIAIVNFENKTGNKDLDIWSTGIRDLLITDLNQSKFMAVLSESDIYGILKKFDLADTSTYSTDDLIKIADAGGAQYTVSGSFLSAGDRIIINATCQKPHSREVISPIQVNCRGFNEEIGDRIDEMTRKIKADLNLTPAQISGDIDQNIGEISTPNAEAWAYYVESRRYHFRGEYTKAIPLLHKALSLDPEFIMANRALGVAYMNISDYPNRKRYDSRTLELVQSHPERISDHDRLFIEQNHYLWQSPEPEFEKSLEAGRKLLALYSDDIRASYNMGVLYSRIEDWDEALKYFETCVRRQDRFWGTYGWMSDALLAKGEPAKAQEVMEKYIRDIENTAVGHRSLAYHHIRQNRLDLSSRELEASELLAPDDYNNRILRSVLLIMKGNLPEAEAVYRALIGEKVPAASYAGYAGLISLLRFEGRYKDTIKMLVPLAEQFKGSGLARPEWACHYALARSYSRLGRLEAALDECRKAYAIDTEGDDFRDKREIIYTRGLSYIESKQLAEAEKTAGELKAFIEKGLNKKIIRLYDHLMGAIELGRNNMPKALEYLERAVRSEETNSMFIDMLAAAYIQAGDLARARKEYEKITRLTSRDDVYARSFYRLGLVDEKLGDKAEARENYQKFLDLWKNADADLPELADARNRLNALR